MSFDENNPGKSIIKTTKYLRLYLDERTYEFSMNSYSDLSLMVGRSFDEEEDVTNIGVLSNCNALLGQIEMLSLRGAYCSIALLNQLKNALVDINKISLYDENNKLYGLIQNGINIYYYVRDSLGNILGIVDNNGILVVKYNYDAYGHNISHTGTNIYNPFLYKGYYYDYDLKMYYCHTRFYNPLWRRWLTPDNPCYLNQEIISGMNLFVYCNNNPVMNVDEEGMFWITLTIGLSIGTYEILVALGILAAGATVTAVAITESEYHYIENGIKSIGNQESSLDIVQDIDEEDFNPHRGTSNGKNRLKNKHEEGEA